MVVDEGKKRFSEIFSIARREALETIHPRCYESIAQVFANTFGITERRTLPEVLTELSLIFQGSKKDARLCLEKLSQTNSLLARDIIASGEFPLWIFFGSRIPERLYPSPDPFMEYIPDLVAAINQDYPLIKKLAADDILNLPNEVYERVSDGLNENGRRNLERDGIKWMASTELK